MYSLMNPFERKQIKTFQKRLEELAARHGYGDNAQFLDEIIAKAYPNSIEDPDFPDWEIYYKEAFPQGKEDDLRFFAFHRRDNDIITAAAGGNGHKDVLKWLNETEETTVQAEKGRKTVKMTGIVAISAYAIFTYLSLPSFRPHLRWVIPMMGAYFTSLYFLYCHLSGNLKRITVPDSLVNHHLSIGKDALYALQDLYQIKN